MLKKEGADSLDRKTIKKSAKRFPIEPEMMNTLRNSKFVITPFIIKPRIINSKLLVKSSKGP